MKRAVGCVKILFEDPEKNKEYVNDAQKYVDMWNKTNDLHNTIVYQQPGIGNCCISFCNLEPCSSGVEKGWKKNKLQITQYESQVPFPIHIF